MIGRVDWILLLFGLCLSASLVQGNDAEGEEYEYVEDGNDDGKGNQQPVITTTPQQIVVTEGDDIRLECRGHHFEHYSVIWTKLPNFYISINGEHSSAVKNESAHYENLETGTLLVIKGARLSDAGSYECKLLPNMTIVHTVIVHGRDGKLMVPYITLHPANSVSINQDDSINLTCTVNTGGKQIEFYWQRKNQDVYKKMRIEDTVVSQKSQTTVENKLMLKSVSRHDAGDYVCIFQDDLGKAESVVRVEVNFSPVIETRRDAVHSAIGRAVELKCVVHAVPHPTVTWFKSDKNDKSKKTPIIQRQGYQMRSDHHAHILFISSLTQNDFGTYTCEAKNGFTKAGVANIEISGAPSQPMLVGDKTKLGEEHMSYNLVWKVESTIPLESNVLRYRKDPDPTWTEIKVEGKQIANQPSFYEVAYTLHNLTSSSTYEATLKSMNKQDWSVESRIHRFTINGKSYTDTMELSDDKGSKAHSPVGSSLLVPASIFLSFLIRRW